MEFKIQELRDFEAFITKLMERKTMGAIQQETAARIWQCYREIETAENEQANSADRKSAAAD